MNITPKSLRKQLTFENIVMLASCICAMIFVYGLPGFPDGPITPCVNHIFCDKLGHRHTLHDYLDYIFWDRALNIASAVVVLAGLPLLKKKLDNIRV